MMDEIEKVINEVLDGIDKTETEGGWWETSTGAEFGKEKREELITKLKQELVKYKQYVLELDRELQTGESYAKIQSTQNN